MANMSLLQFVFIGEVEAAGADSLGMVEEEARRCTMRPDLYRYSTADKDGLSKLVRPLGGLNVLLIGDWWQLHPTGGIAIMSNRFARAV